MSTGPSSDLRSDVRRLVEAIPLPETPDDFGAFPRLSNAQIQRLASYGRQRSTEVGDVLYTAGERTDQFMVVCHGKVAIVGGAGPSKHVVRVHGPGRFLGELGTLEGQPAYVSAVVAEAGQILALTTEALREVTLDDHILADLILRAYLVRRSILIGHGEGFRIVGSCYAPDTRRLLEFAARNRLPHQLVDLERNVDAETLLRGLGVGVEDTPVIVLNSRRTLRNPSNAELAEAMGLQAAPTATCDIVVVGAGPAGLSAAVYAASDGLSVVAADAVAVGGQAGTSSNIENYLGFPTGISGAELAERARLQAQKFGAQLTVPNLATGLHSIDGNHKVTFDDGTDVTTRTVIIATGARYRRLQLPDIERFESTSIHYAATLHEARACGTDAVAVVGGGNSAGQATLFLAQSVQKIHLVAREPALGESMSRYLVDQIERHPRVEVHSDSQVCELEGGAELSSVVVRNDRTGERSDLPVRALFVFIGTDPYTSWLDDDVSLDAGGYVLTGDEVSPMADGPSWRHLRRGPLTLETSRPGVFAVGDVRSGSTKRVASAIGEGAMAARLAYEHIRR